MNLRASFVLTALIALAFATTASADARTDTVSLHRIILSSMNAYLDLGKSGLTPAGALTRLEIEVKRPVEKAQITWWDALHDSSDEATYHPFMICNSAAQSIQDLADEITETLKGSGAKSPKFEDSEKYFASDLTECEVALGITPTFLDE